MSTVNHHIKDFLEYYIGLEQPQYAVLLSGKWGSGKTYFINRFKNNYVDRKYIQVSLFGLKSKEDIHKQVIFKLFGIKDGKLAKAMDILGNIAKGLLNKHAGVNIGLADIPLEMVLDREENKNIIFIFDDLERIDTGLSEVLGYINILIEELGQRAILLANEEEIKDRQFYDTFKEKTIGKTFQIEQEFDVAFTSFLQELKNSQEILQINQSDIKAVFDIAGYRNLRSLRQGMLDFDRLINSFEDKFKNHTGLMNNFLKVFFAFIFETKSGKHTISPLKDLLKGQIFEEEDEQKPFIDYIAEEYYLDHSILPNSLWLKLHWNQYLTIEDISESLNKSRYFLQEQREEWVKLWHYLNLEEEEFQSALSKTLDKLQKNEYLEPEIFMHVLGILLRLQERSLYSPSREQIVIDMKSYIDKNTKKWINLEIVDEERIENDYAGLGYINEETSEFQDVKRYLLLKAKEAIYGGLSKQADTLIEYLNKKDIETFIDVLSANSRRSILYRLPVFQSMSSDEFFKTLINVENKYFRDVSGLLIKRYEKVHFEEYLPLLDELNFWKKLCEMVKTHVESNQGTIKIVLLDHFSKSIDEKIIQKIEKKLQQIEKEKNNV